MKPERKGDTAEETKARYQPLSQLSDKTKPFTQLKSRANPQNCEERGSVKQNVAARSSDTSTQKIHKERGG